MTINRNCAIALLGLGCILDPACAAELKLLTAGAYKPVVMALVPDFEKQTGHTVTVQNDTAGALARRVSGGEPFDVVVLTPGVLRDLAQSSAQGAANSPAKVLPDSIRTLARIAIGVAVKQGAPVPDISTVARFKEALLAARAVAYIDPEAGGSSGIYLSQWMEKAGIADRVRPKAVLVPGGLVAQRVVNGQADIALHQISEILAVPGAQLVGPIPAEIQNYTVYAGAVSTGTRDAAAAKALLDHLGSPAAQAVLRDKGMQAP